MDKPKHLKGFHPMKMVAKINETIDYTHKTRPVNGTNTTVDDGPDGRPINVSGSTGGGDGGGGGDTIVVNPPFDPSDLQSQIDAQEATITSMQTTITALQTAVTTLQNRLNNATGSGTCTGDEIEIEFSFPE